MTIRFETCSENPELYSRYFEEGGDIWGEGMEWIAWDPVCRRYWDRLPPEFPDFQFIAHDPEGGTLLGHANTAPFAWDGVDSSLPDGVDGVLPLAFEESSRGVPPTTLCALLAGVQPGVRAAGLSTKLLGHMKEIARRNGFHSVVAPVRPSLKHRYPLTPMETYVTWRREDGLPLDPWLRVHERMGARFAGICQGSNEFRGTVKQWEEWTGLALPQSGIYVVPGALSPLIVDRDEETAFLIEPNVWMVHEV